MNFALRFTKDALVFVDANQFESSVDHFLDRAVDANSNDRAALLAQYSALTDERQDDDIAAWRRLEAKLGYDVDDAPEVLVKSLLAYVDTYGRGGVEEAIVAHQGEEAVDTLKKAIRAAEQSRIICDLQHAVGAAG